MTVAEQVPDGLIVPVLACELLELREDSCEGVFDIVAVELGEVVIVVVELRVTVIVIEPLAVGVCERVGVSEPDILGERVPDMLGVPDIVVEVLAVDVCEGVGVSDPDILDD